MALEVLEEFPGCTLMLLPLRVYECGISFIAGAALLTKLMRPGVQIAVAQLDHHTNVFNEVITEQRQVNPMMPEISLKIQLGTLSGFKRDRI